MQQAIIAVLCIFLYEFSSKWSGDSSFSREQPAAIQVMCPHQFLVLLLNVMSAASKNVMLEQKG